MNTTGGKKFSFRKPSNRGNAASRHQNSFGAQKSSDRDRVPSGFPRPNPYANQGRFESPSKKLKFIKNSEIVEQSENFDIEIDDVELDLDDDDFTKDLTIDELNMLEVEASQQTERKTEEGKFPALLETGHQFLYQSKLQPSSNYPEKTLDLFSHLKSIDSSLPNEDSKPESYRVVKIEQLENDLVEYTQKVKQLQDAALSKEGEVKMLRQSLNRAKEEKSKLILQLQKAEGGRQEKTSENEMQLQREVERLQTQLQFKEKEIMEAKEWRTRNEPEKGICNSPKAPLQLSNKDRSSPVSSASKCTSFNQNVIFQQNSFESPKKSLRKIQPSKGQKASNRTNSENRELMMSNEKYHSSCKNVDYTHKEVAAIEKDLLEMCAKLHFRDDVQTGYLCNLVPEKELSMSYHFIVQCICNLRGKEIQNIISVLEIIERNINMSAVTRDSKHQNFDLLCRENGTLISEGLYEQMDFGSSQCRMAASGAALIVLMVILKHSSFVQDIFLKAFNAFVKSSKTFHKQEIHTKKFAKKEYLAADNQFKHILVQKDLHSECDESLSTGQEHNTKNADKIISEHENYSPKNLICKLFQLLTAEKQREEEKIDVIYEILVCLSSSRSQVSKSGLVTRLAEQNILGLLSGRSDFSSVMALLLILKNLSFESGFENIICFCPDSCPMKAIYKALVTRNESWDVFEWQQIKIEAIQTLMSVTSCCPRALKILVASDCSHELVKSLVIMLFEEYKDIREDFELQIDNVKLENSKKFLLLRQGMSLLAQISWNDKQFMDHRVDVEWQYLDLIYGTIRLFRRIPLINENEVISVQDLRDIEQYEESEDSEGGTAERPMEQN